MEAGCGIGSCGLQERGDNDGFNDWVVPMGLVFDWFQRWVVVLVVMGSRRGVVVLVLVIWWFQSIWFLVGLIGGLWVAREGW